MRLPPEDRIWRRCFEGRPISNSLERARCEECARRMLKAIGNEAIRAHTAAFVRERRDVLFRPRSSELRRVTSEDAWDGSLWENLVDSVRELERILGIDDIDCSPDKGEKLRVLFAKLMEKEYSTMATKYHELAQRLQDRAEDLSTYLGADDPATLDCIAASEGIRELLSAAEIAGVDLAGVNPQRTSEPASWADCVAQLRHRIGRQPTLGELMTAARSYRMKSWEVDRQRESFVRGMTPTGDPRLD